MTPAIRNNWSLEEIYDICQTPLHNPVFKAATVYHQFNETAEVQLCVLSNLKSGRCLEDCADCLQAARCYTDVIIHAPVYINGKPLEKNREVANCGMVHVIATARILIIQTMVRLSAARAKMSVAGQAMCFKADANSIFAGSELLTIPKLSFDKNYVIFPVAWSKAA